MVFKIEKRGGAYCHLGTDEHTCTWIEKCVNVFYIEDLNFFFFFNEGCVVNKLTTRSS